MNAATQTAATCDTAGCIACTHLPNDMTALSQPALALFVVLQDIAKGAWLPEGGIVLQIRDKDGEQLIVFCAICVLC
jgi:hypothetical protein